MKEVKPSKKPLAIYYAIVLAVLLLLNLVLLPWMSERQVEEVDYGTFMTMTEEKNIGRVDIESNQIIFTDKEEKQVYKTGLMNDPELTQRLYDAGAQFSSEIVEQGSPMLNFLIWFLLPILLFRDIAAGRITEQFNAKFFFFCAGVTAVYFFVIWAGAAIFLRDKSMVGAFTQGAFRGSQAILGVAFVQNLYGDAGLVPLMIVASVPLYNIFSVLVLTVTAPDARTADHHGVVRRTLRGIITNPIILGILAGLPFSLLSIDFPPMADKFLSMLGGCATPMALLSIGAGFEGAKAIKKLGPTLAAAFIKTVGLAAVFLPCAVALGFRNEELVALLIMLGSPTTPSAYVMSRNMGHEGVLTSSCIALTTLLSALTLTGWIFVLRSGGYL